MIGFLVFFSGMKLSLSLSYAPFFSRPLILLDPRDAAVFEGGGFWCDRGCSACRPTRIPDQEYSPHPEIVLDSLEKPVPSSSQQISDPLVCQEPADTAQQRASFSTLVTSSSLDSSFGLVSSWHPPLYPSPFYSVGILYTPCCDIAAPSILSSGTHSRSWKNSTEHPSELFVEFLRVLFISYS